MNRTQTLLLAALGAAVALPVLGQDEVEISEWSTWDEPAPIRQGLFSGLYPHVYVKGGGMVVFPIATDAESDPNAPGADELEFRGDIGGGFFAAAGFRLGPGKRPDEPGVGYRFEFEYANRTYDPDGLFFEDLQITDTDGEIDVTTIMGTVMVDVTSSDFRGYIGLGAGVAQVDVTINNVDDDDTKLAFQLPIGFETRLLPNLWFDVGCRWLFVPGIDTMTDVTEFSVLTAELYAGLTLEF